MLTQKFSFAVEHCVICVKLELNNINVTQPISKCAKNKNKSKHYTTEYNVVAS